MILKAVLKPLGGTILTLIIALGIAMLMQGKNQTIAKLYHWNAHFKFKSGNFEDAIKDYTKAIQYNDKDVNTFISRGSSYLDLDQYENAIKDYNLALGLDSNNAHIYAYRGRAYYEMKMGPESLADYNMAIIIDNNFAWAFYYRGLLNYAVLHQFKKGCKDF